MKKTGQYCLGDVWHFLVCILLSELGHLWFWSSSGGRAGCPQIINRWFDSWLRQYTRQARYLTLNFFWCVNDSSPLMDRLTPNTTSCLQWVNEWIWPVVQSPLSGQRTRKALSRCSLFNCLDYSWHKFNKVMGWTWWALRGSKYVKKTSTPWHHHRW